MRSKIEKIGALGWKFARCVATVSRAHKDVGGWRLTVRCLDKELPHVVKLYTARRAACQDARKLVRRPDPETMEALREWKELHGAVWVEKLTVAWLRGGAPPLLQRLRNTHGPDWLAEQR